MILMHAQVGNTIVEPELSPSSSERTLSPVSAYTDKLMLFLLTSRVLFSVFLMLALNHVFVT